MRARAAVVGALAAAGFGLAVLAGGVAPASADPVLPVDPTIPQPVPVDAAAPPAADPAVAPADPAAAPATAAAPQTLLGQFAQSAQSNPLAIMQDLLAGSPQPAAVGATPPAPGTNPGPDPISLAMTMNPRNFRMPTSDQASPYALAPNDNPSLFDRVNAFKGVHALAHSNLGRMPGDEPGQPLPGTAPPPGTNIPAGLEQYYVDPAAALPPAIDPTVDQLLLPTVPPPN